MKGKLKFLVIAVVVVAGVMGVVRWRSTDDGDAAIYPIELFGNIDIRTADIGFNEQERIARIWVEEGQRVDAGQVIARLDTRRIEAQLDQVRAQIAAQQEVVKRLETGSRPEEIQQARAEVAAAEALVRNALQSFKRLRTTSQAGVTSAQALDDAAAQVDTAQAQLKIRKEALALALAGPRQEEIQAARHTLAALQAARSLLEVRLADMTLVAPAAGVVRNRILEPGEIANPGRPVITLALTDPKWVRVYVPEPQLAHIKPGLQAKIYTDAFADRPFYGWVGFISPVAEFTPKNVETEALRTHLVYEARIFLKDPDDHLRLGMPVSVAVESQLSPDAPPPAQRPDAANQG